MGEPDFAVGEGSGGRSQLYVDGHLVSSIEVPNTVEQAFGIIGVTCGRDGTDSVSPDDCAVPNDFTGEIRSVTLDLSGDLIVDSDTELRRLLA